MTAAPRPDAQPHRDAAGGTGRPAQRNTRQRTAILEILGEQEEFRTAQQIHESLRSSGASVGLATVYRNLQAMATAGQVDTLASADGEALYRQCAAEHHHHHLVCRECGSTVEFDAPQLERELSAIAREHGFTSIQHTMEVFGLCPEHQAAADDQS